MFPLLVYQRYVAFWHDMWSIILSPSLSSTKPFKLRSRAFSQARNATIHARLRCSQRQALTATLTPQTKQKAMILSHLFRWLFFEETAAV
jgi:hypothetical protein